LSGYARIFPEIVTLCATSFSGYARKKEKPFIIVMWFVSLCATSHALSGRETA